MIANLYIMIIDDDQVDICVAIGYLDLLITNKVNLWQYVWKLLT